MQHFFPWWWEESYRRAVPGEFTASEEEAELMRVHALEPEQIVFRREIRATFRELAPQEYAEDPESCFLSSGDCAFELDLLEQRLAAAPEPCEIRDGGRLQVWYPPLEARQYIMGVDTAGGGTKGDYACAQVVDKAKGMQCAELHGHFAPAELARRIAALGREYNEALIAVETNNHGHAVLAHLTKVERYGNVYQTKEGKPGWTTSVANRAPMIAHLTALVAELPELLCSARLMRECRSFVRREDGSYAAASGAHDDCVIAMAIAQMVRDEVMVKVKRS